jgi:putative oxidoreductase
MFEKIKAALKPYAPLPVRFGLGLTALVHGWAHAQGPGSLTRALERADLPAAGVLTWVAVGIELAGGLLMLLGFQARLTAFFLATWFLALSFAVVGRDGWWADAGGLEHPLLLGLCALAILTGGPGRASVDSLRGKA